MTGHRITQLALLLGVSVLVVAAPAGAAVVTKPTKPLPPWTMLSAAAGSTTDAPALLRDNEGVLYAAWRESEGGTFGVRARTLDSKGIWSGASSVASGWTTLTNPTLFGSTGQAGIAWAGSAGGAADARASGRAWYAALVGTTWTRSLEPLTETAAPSSAIALGSTVAADGTPYFVWSGGGGIFGTHRGLARAGAEASLAGACCQHAANIARDGRTGAVSVVYTSSEGGSAGGIYARQIAPELLAPTKYPGAASTATSVSRTVPLAAAARTSGGVYTAYCDPAPACSRVRVASNDGRSMLIKPPATPSAGSIGVAAGPAGTMWVYWADRHNLYAARSNRAFTKWGATVKLGLPAGAAAAPLYVAGDAGRRALDLVANVNGSGGTRIWGRRALPGLDVTATPASLRAGALQLVRFRMQDAGMGVRGTITFAGVTHTTNGGGVATFLVSPTKRPGRYPVTASAVGYTAAEAGFTLRR